MPEVIFFNYVFGIYMLELGLGLAVECTKGLCGFLDLF